VRNGQQVNAMRSVEPGVAKGLDAFAWPKLDLMMLRAKRHDALVATRNAATMYARRDVMDGDMVRAASDAAKRRHPSKVTTL
jgi:hypothetical protein